MASYKYTFTSGATVTPARLNDARDVFDIVNADIKSNAAIDGTKISPAFGPQDITLGSGNRSISTTTNHALAFGTNNAERMRIGNNGQVIIGHNATVNVTGSAGFEGLQIHALGSTPSTTFSRWTNDAGGINMSFVKSRSGTVGTLGGAVASGNTIGNITWLGDDGTNSVSAAQITAQVDGTPGTNDMPGRLIFSTTADGASSVTERMRIDSAGRVLVGGSSNIGFQTLQVHSASPADVAGVYRWVNDSAGPRINLVKSRGASVGTSTIVQNGDGLGAIRFQGADGADTASVGASIEAFVDGTPGSDDMPGRLVFGTTEDGASTATERMRITSAGNVGIATTAPQATLHVSRGTANGGAAQFAGTNQASHFAYSTDEHTYIRGGKTASNVYVADLNTGDVILATGGGNVGVNTSSPSVKLDVNGIVNTNATYRVNGQIVVGARRTGWTAPTGTATRATFDSGTVTLSQLAARVHALIDDLAAHGLIDS